MTSKLETQMAADIARTVFNADDPVTPWEYVTYTADGESPLENIPAVITPEEIDDPDRSPRTRYDVRMVKAHFQVSDIAVPSVAGKDKIAFGDYEYGLMEVLWSNAATWTGSFRRGQRARQDTGDSSRRDM